MRRERDEEESSSVIIRTPPNRKNYIYRSRARAGGKKSARGCQRKKKVNSKLLNFPDSCARRNGRLHGLYTSPQGFFSLSLSRRDAHLPPFSCPRPLSLFFSFTRFHSASLPYKLISYHFGWRSSRTIEFAYSLSHSFHLPIRLYQHLHLYLNNGEIKSRASAIIHF